MRYRKKALGAEVKRSFREKGITSQNEMAAAASKAGIAMSQPTINRILNGTYGREPECLRGLCRYLGIRLNSFVIDPDPSASASLMGALRAAWDGSAESEQFLARVIKAAGRLGQSASERTV